MTVVTRESIIKTVRNSRPYGIDHEMADRRKREVIRRQQRLQKIAGRI